MGPGRKLNLGCGTDIRPPKEGWVNLDIAALPGVDVVHDQERLPWPFPDGHFEHILCSHVLEHVPGRLPDHRGDGLLLVLEEMHRILAPKGTAEILLPIFFDERYWADPTHRRVIPIETFQFLEPDTDKPWYSHARFRIKELEYRRPGPRNDRWLPLGPKRIGVLRHVWERAPFLRPLVPRRYGEMRVVLERAEAAKLGAPAPGQGAAYGRAHNH